MENVMTPEQRAQLIKLHKEVVSAHLRIAGTIAGSNARTRAQYAADLADKRFNDFVAGL